MLLSGLSSVYSVCSVAAGIAGNIFAFERFVSPIPTFKRIIRNGSTEQFSGQFNWAVFQSIYISIYVTFAEKAMKLKMSGLLIAGFTLFGIIVYVSMRFFDYHEWQTFVGYLSQVPNGLGTILGLVQLALYSYYSQCNWRRLEGTTSKSICLNKSVGGMW